MLPGWSGSKSDFSSAVSELVGVDRATFTFEKLKGWVENPGWESI